MVQKDRSLVVAESQPHGRCWGARTSRRERGNPFSPILPSNPPPVPPVGRTGQATLAEGRCGAAPALQSGTEEDVLQPSGCGLRTAIHAHTPSQSLCLAHCILWRSEDVLRVLPAVQHHLHIPPGTWIF